MNIDQAWRRLREGADRAAQRGSLIFHLDLAAAAASAAFAADGIAPDGLATLIDETGYRVIAFDAAPLSRAVAAVRFDAGGRAITDIALQGVPPRAETLARARRTIAAARLDGPAQRRVAVVIPATDAHGPLEGYAITVGDTPATMRVDGHWHFTLDPDGRSVVESQPLAAVVGQGPTPDDLQSAGDLPNELHTYLSLKHGVPIRVLTAGSGVRWRVDGERTEPIGDSSHR